ncbi:MAG: (d)CMP kinase [Clostridia bacterium]|nr:(d)CMP kinase [Clostridia bacterium]
MIGIAIDGPSGAGKSTIAKALAKEFGYIYVDTGAIYRTVGLYMYNIGVSTDDKEGIVKNLHDVRFELRYENGEQKMYLCGEDVSDKIRTPIIAKYASVVSAVPEVRAFLLETQKKLARENNVIMDGRDIGTVILPDADVKIFLTASAESRADRRVKQLAEKGEIVSFDDILASIKERDERDSGRDVAPLKPAEDAVTLDTSDMNLEESIAAAKKIAEDKLSKKKDKSTSKFYWFIVNTFAPIVRFIMRIKTYGKKNEQKDGALIVCANHTAMFDVISLAASFDRQLRFLAKKEIFKVPVLAQFARAMGAYSVDRGHGDVAAIKKTLSLLSEGESVCMFPQGTRYPHVDPANTEVKSGVGMMLYRSGADVQPVFIRVKNFKYRFLRKKEVIIGRPIKYEEFGFVNGGKEEYQRAAEMVFERILALRNEETDK